VVDLDSAVEQHELQIAVADGEHQIPSHGPKDRLSCELPPLEAITQTHPDARPIVPHSIIREVRQRQSLQQNLPGSTSACVTREADDRGLAPLYASAKSGHGAIVDFTVRIACGPASTPGSGDSSSDI
jgi:hypothetical protein